ncbi:hypothetical protein Tco_1475490 [Tanacetum coccineum]
MLKRCEDTNLSLNWEKSHFMVKEGIVLGHKISKSGIEVDRAKVEVIAKLPHPTTVRRGVRISLAHDWDMPFETDVRCYAIDFALGASPPGKEKTSIFNAIHLMLADYETRLILITQLPKKNYLRGVCLEEILLQIVYSPKAKWYLDQSANKVTFCQ